MPPTQPSHRRTPAATNIRNPFTRQPSHMRRNTISNKWISVPSTNSPPFGPPVSTHPSPAHAVEIRIPARNDSHKASVILGGEDSGSLVASSGVLSPFLEYEIGSPFDFDVRAPPTVVWDEKSKPRPQPKVQFAGVVAQMHVSPVSPEGEWKTKRRDSPISVMDLGWEHTQPVRSEREEEQKGLGVNLFSDFDDTCAAARTVGPQIPPRPVKPYSQLGLADNGKAKYPPPLNKKTEKELKAPPAVVRRYENGKEKDGLSYFLDRTREIYHAGPKGEGQKMWSGIRKLREERKKKNNKQTIKQSESFQGTGFENVKKSAEIPPPPHPAMIRPQAQGKFQPQTATRSQYLKDKPYPRLPSELARLYPLSPITERESASTAREAQAMRQRKSKAKGKEPMRQSEATTASFPQSIEIPLKASDSVQYDAQNADIDMSASGLSSLYLQPALTTRNGFREASASSPRVPEKIPPPVPSKNDAHSAGPKVSQFRAMGAQALAPKYTTLIDVQQQRPNFDRNAERNQSREYIPVCLPQSKEREHKVDWLHKMGHLKVPAMPLDWTHTDKDFTKKHDKLKAKIGQPRPLAAHGEIVNVAEESGGVGGPAAARWISPVHISQAVILDASKKGKEKQKEAPLRPKRPTYAQKPSKPWIERWGQSPNELMEGTSSFACQGVDNTDFYHPPGLQQAQRPGEETSRATSVNDTDTDLVPAHEELHPAPLFSGSGGGANNNHGEDEARGRAQIRNTRFYQPYGEILQQYDDDQYDENYRF